MFVQLNHCPHISHVFILSFYVQVSIQTGTLDQSWLLCPCCLCLPWRGLGSAFTRGNRRHVEELSTQWLEEYWSYAEVNERKAWARKEMGIYILCNVKFGLRGMRLSVIGVLYNSIRILLERNNYSVMTIFVAHGTLRSCGTAKLNESTRFQINW